jgi:hypothetical protein
MRSFSVVSVLNIVAVLVLSSNCLVAAPNKTANANKIDSIALWCFDLVNKDEAEWTSNVVGQLKNVFKTAAVKSKEKYMVLYTVQTDRMIDVFNSLLVYERANGIKVWAVKSTLSDNELIDYRNFMKSPLGVKYTRYSDMLDSLEPEDAMKAIDFTLSEASELNKLVEGGIIGKVNEASVSFRSKYRDSTVGYLNVWRGQVQKQVEKDPFLFIQGGLQPEPTAEERQKLIEDEIKALTNELKQNNSAESNVSKMTQDEMQRKVVIEEVIRINNDPKPCDRYLCKWGADARTIIDEAKRLGMKLEKDSTDGLNTRILQYTDCTFYVDTKKGYFKISTDHRFSLMSQVTNASIKKVKSDLFAESWKVIDTDSMSGYGLCEDWPNSAVIHSRINERGRERAFIELITLSQ